MSRNPYVGPRALRVGEKLPARAREQRELTDLLIAERTVLLHSPSGAGKTSLIYAGIVPLLGKERVGGTDFQAMSLPVSTPPPPNHPVHNRYVYSIALALLPGHDPQELQFLRLSEVLGLARQQAASGIWVLIFDQFEKILTIDPADRHNREVFFQQLRSVLADGYIWALFSIREEYIGGLDRFVRSFPDYLHTTYRLDFFGPAAVKTAIQEPAADQGVVFTDEAAAELLRRLRTVRVGRPNHHVDEIEAPYVEPFQLQVVCQKLWQRLDKERGNAFKSIEVGDIERHADIGRALRRYYGDIVGEVARTTKADESEIRDWFETRLITEQHFRSQTQTGPTSGEADAQRILRALQDAYLIRSDSRASVTWYELSHDNLIEPVLESNEIARRHPQRPPLK